MASDDDPPPEGGGPKKKSGGSWQEPELPPFDWEQESAFPKPLPKLPEPGPEPTVAAPLPPIPGTEPFSLPPVPAFGEEPPIVKPVPPPAPVKPVTRKVGPKGESPGMFASGGSMKSQDAATARPRPATPAELRASEKYEQKQREIEEARLEAEEKRRKRNRRLIGAGVGVGVVGVVAGLGYWAFSAPTVTAQCVRDDPNGQPVIVPDSYCTGHTAGLNGFFFYGGHQYRYYYGSTGGIGSRPFGGTTTRPSGATIKTSSGHTIQRGGLGGKMGGGGS